MLRVANRADSWQFSQIYFQAHIFITNIAQNEIWGPYSGIALYEMMTLYINMNLLGEVYFLSFYKEFPLILFTYDFFLKKLLYEVNF